MRDLIVGERNRLFLQRVSQLFFNPKSENLLLAIC